MKQQTDLYYPYQTDLDLLDDELFANRTTLTITDASLPNRAGKAFVQLMDAICSAYEQPNGELLQFRWAVWRLVPQRHEPKPTPLKGSAASAFPVMIQGVNVRLLVKALRMPVEDQGAELATSPIAQLDPTGLQRYAGRWWLRP